MKPLGGLAVLLTAALLLAGCADSNEGKTPPSLKEAEKAAANLDVEATSTTGVIRGIVVDESIRPLAGAFVGVTGIQQTQTTNEQGVFGFDGLEAGTYFLSASLADYSTVQQSVEVVAGINNPEPVKILLAAVPRATPFIEALQAKIFIDASVLVLSTGFTLGGVTTDNGYFFHAEIQPNGTVAQVELVWESSNPLGENANIFCGTYGGDDSIQGQTQNGPTNMVFRLNATEGDDTADDVYCEVFADAVAPAGVIVNTEFNAFIHVFHNIVPREDWQFGRDGEYPL